MNSKRQLTCVLLFAIVNRVHIHSLWPDACYMNTKCTYIQGLQYLIVNFYTGCSILDCESWIIGLPLTIVNRVHIHSLWPDACNMNTKCTYIQGFQYLIVNFYTGCLIHTWFWILDYWFTIGYCKQNSYSQLVTWFMLHEYKILLQMILPESLP